MSSLVFCNGIATVCLGVFRASDPMTLTRLKDERGNRYGRLYALRHVGSSSLGLAQWFCFCNCGGRTVVLGSNLRSGQTRSCGCLQRKSNVLGKSRPDVSLRFRVDRFKRLLDRDGIVLDWFDGTKLDEVIDEAKKTTARIADEYDAKAKAKVRADKKQVSKQRRQELEARRRVLNKQRDIRLEREAWKKHKEASPSFSEDLLKDFKDQELRNNRAIHRAARRAARGRDEEAFRQLVNGMDDDRLLRWINYLCQTNTLSYVNRHVNGFGLYVKQAGEDFVVDDRRHSRSAS